MSKRESLIAFCNRAFIILVCKEKRDLAEKMDNLKRYLQLGDYPLHFISSPLNPTIEIICPKNQGKSLASAFLPSVNSVSEKFKCVGN